MKNKSSVLNVSCDFCHIKMQYLFMYPVSPNLFKLLQKQTLNTKWNLDIFSVAGIELRALCVLAKHYYRAMAPVSLPPF